MLKLLSIIYFLLLKKNVRFFKSFFCKKTRLFFSWMTHAFEKPKTRKTQSRYRILSSFSRRHEVPKKISFFFFGLVFQIEKCVFVLDGTLNICKLE